MDSRGNGRTLGARNGLGPACAARARAGLTLVVVSVDQFFRSGKGVEESIKKVAYREDMVCASCELSKAEDRTMTRTVWSLVIRLVARAYFVNFISVRRPPLSTARWLTVSLVGGSSSVRLFQSALLATVIKIILIINKLVKLPPSLRTSYFEGYSISLPQARSPDSPGGSSLYLWYVSNWKGQHI